MGKYILVIKNAISGEEATPVEFGEKIQEEAKAKSYRLLLNEAAQYADGEYTGELYRKNVILSKWEEVNGAPMIACKVESGKAKLTVDRVVYGYERQHIKRLLQIHVELGKLQPNYLACLNSTNVLAPTPVLSFVDEIVQVVETLHTDYDPEYLQDTVYPNIVIVLKRIASSIKNSYDSYAGKTLADIYTTEIVKCIGEIQISIQEVLEPIQIDGIIK